MDDDTFLFGQELFQPAYSESFELDALGASSEQVPSELSHTEIADVCYGVKNVDVVESSILGIEWLWEW